MCVCVREREREREREKEGSVNDRRMRRKQYWAWGSIVLAIQAMRLYRGVQESLVKNRRETSHLAYALQEGTPSTITQEREMASSLLKI